MIFHHSKNAGKVSVPVLYILSSLQGSVMSYETYDSSQLGEEKSYFSVLTRKCHLLSIQRSYGPIDSLSTKWAGYSSWDNHWISIPKCATWRGKLRIFGTYEEVPFDLPCALIWPNPSLSTQPTWYSSCQLGHTSVRLESNGTSS